MQSETLQNVYEFANMFARNLRIAELESQHVLYALSRVENEAQRFLTNFGLTEDKLEPRSKGRGGLLRDSSEVDELNERAAKIAETLGEADTNCIHTLLAMLTMKGTYAYQKISYFLEERGTSPSDFFVAIARELPNGILLKNLGMPKVTKEATPHVEETKDDVPYELTVDRREGKKTDENVIQYGIDLTERATLGGLDPAIGRDVETERVIQTLTRRTKNNPVLIGEPGVGKTTVVEGLALRMAKGQVPAELQGKRLIQLDMASMVAGTRYRGDFEERLTGLINQVIADGDIILFIDEIHNMVGTGGTSTGAMDAAEILKPALARGDLHVIGATSIREYRMYIEKDPALERRFQPIMVDEPSIELAMEIVKGVKAK